MPTLGGSHWKRLAGGAGACVIAASALAACGGSATGPSASPKVQLQSSFKSLYSSPTVSFDFHLAATASQLHAVAPTIPTPYDSVITGASIVLRETTTNGQSLYSLQRSAQAAGTPTAAINSLRQVSIDLAVNAGGNELLDFRLLNGVLYARAAIKDALALIGQTPSYLAPDVRKIPAGAQYDFARSALAGNWVSFDVVGALDGVLSTAPVVSPAQTKAQEAKLFGAFDAVFSKDVTVANAGSASGGATKLALSANEHTLLSDLAAAFMQLVPTTALPGKVGPPNLSKVPNRTITADALVNGTALTGLEINLAQFIHGVSPTTKPLMMVASVTHPAVSIITPTGATSASLPALEALFAGLGATTKVTTHTTPASA